METLKLIKLADKSPEKEGYYFVVLFNGEKHCEWWNEKYGFVLNNESEVYGWYDESEPDWSALELAFESGKNISRHNSWVQNCKEAGYNKEELAEVTSLAPPYTNFETYKAHINEKQSNPIPKK